MVRPRSLSCFTPKPKPFDSDTEDEDESEELPRPSSAMSAKSDNSDHNKSEITKLLLEQLIELETTYQNIPYSSRLKRIDWSKVQVEGCAEDDLKLHLAKALRNVRKRRSLLEILQEAKENLKNPRKNPDYPSMPKSTYEVFVKMNYQKVKEQNPDLTPTELFRLIAKMYQTLSEFDKKRYIEIHEKSRKKFQEERAKFVAQHPDLFKKKPIELSKVEEKDMTPFHYYFVQHPEFKPKEAKQNYQSLDSRHKLPFIREFFKADKFRLFSDLPRPDQKAYLEALHVPKVGRTSGYTYFFQKQIESNSLSHIESYRDKIIALGKKWSALSDEEKQKYNQKATKDKAKTKAVYEELLKTLPKDDRRVIAPSKKELAYIKEQRTLRDLANVKVSPPSQSETDNDEPPTKKNQPSTVKPKKTGKVQKDAATLSVKRTREDDEPISNVAVRKKSKKHKEVVEETTSSQEVPSSDPEIRSPKKKKKKHHIEEPPASTKSSPKKLKRKHDDEQPPNDQFKSPEKRQKLNDATPSTSKFNGHVVENNVEEVSTDTERKQKKKKAIQPIVVPEPDIPPP